MSKVQVNKWTGKRLLERKDIIRLQILLHCHLNKIPLNTNDLEYLAELGYIGVSPLSTYCSWMVSSGLCGSEGSARQIIDGLKEKNLILKEGKNRKIVSLNPAMKIQNKGNIMVEVTCLCRE